MKQNELTVDWHCIMQFAARLMIVFAAFAGSIGAQGHTLSISLKNDFSRRNVGAVQNVDQLRTWRQDYLLDLSGFVITPGFLKYRVVGNYNDDRKTSQHFQSSQNTKFKPFNLTINALQKTTIPLNINVSRSLDAVSTGIGEDLGKTNKRVVDFYRVAWAVPPTNILPRIRLGWQQHNISSSNVLINRRKQSSFGFQNQADSSQVSYAIDYTRINDYYPATGEERIEQQITAITRAEIGESVYYNTNTSMRVTPLANYRNNLLNFRYRPNARMTQELRLRTEQYRGEEFTRDQNKVEYRSIVSSAKGLRLTTQANYGIENRNNLGQNTTIGAALLNSRLQWQTRLRMTSFSNSIGAVVNYRSEHDSTVTVLRGNIGSVLNARLGRKFRITLDESIRPTYFKADSIVTENNVRFQIGTSIIPRVFISGELTQRNGWSDGLSRELYSMTGHKTNISIKPTRTIGLQYHQERSVANIGVRSVSPVNRTRLVITESGLIRNMNITISGERLENEGSGIIVKYLTGMLNFRLFAYSCDFEYIYKLFGDQISEEFRFKIQRSISLNF